jgi:hypothetical protein
MARVADEMWRSDDKGGLGQETTRDYPFVVTIHAPDQFPKTHTVKL